jgi:hypothetical protein
MSATNPDGAIVAKELVRDRGERSLTSYLSNVGCRDHAGSGFGVTGLYRWWRSPIATTWSRTSC